MIREIAAVQQETSAALPSARARVRASNTARHVRPRGDACVLRRRHRQIVLELADAKPTYFPSVPRMFEKIYTQATAQVQEAPPEQQEQFRKAVKLGVKVREMEQRGEEVPKSCASRSSRRTHRFSRRCGRSSAARCARPPPAPP